MIVRTKDMPVEYNYYRTKRSTVKSQLTDWRVWAWCVQSYYKGMYIASLNFTYDTFAK